MTDIEKADRITATCMLYTEAEIDATELMMIIEHIISHGADDALDGCHECGSEHGHRDNCTQR